jgi:hypothetical protein
MTVATVPRYGASWSAKSRNKRTRHASERTAINRY